MTAQGRINDTSPMSRNRDSDRVAEIRQRLEAALAEWRIPFVPGGQRFAHHALTAAPDDLAWLLSRLAVVEAERDELRAKAAAGLARPPRGVAS